MITIDRQRTPADLARSIQRLFDVSAAKIRALDRRWGDTSGAPVFTTGGRYEARGWTDWTQGFQFGSALLQFDATGEAEFLELGRRRTLDRMTAHLTHTGVHPYELDPATAIRKVPPDAASGRRHDVPGELGLELGGGVPRLVGVNPAALPVLESAAAYLRRHRLLPGEARRLRPEDYEPEKLDDGDEPRGGELVELHPREGRP